MCSYRLTSAARLAILETTIGQVAGSLAGAGIHVRVADASDADLAARASSAWQSSGLAVDVERAAEPFATALLRLLAVAEEPYFCLQFDDMVTTGLTPAYLAGACSLLERHGTDVGAVAPVWPLDVRLDAVARRIVMTAYRERSDRRGTRYRFWHAPWTRPVAVEEHEGLRFAIFENFGYGFFVNDLVAPTQDYRRRLQWYLERGRTTSVHQVELAAMPKVVGPWWTHVAVCLDGVSLLDLDHVHTGEAVRSDQPRNRDVHDAVADGWDVVARGVPG